MIGHWGCWNWKNNIASKKENEIFFYNLRLDNVCIYYSRWFSALDSSSQSGSFSIAFVKVIGPERVYCADMKIVHAHKYYGSKNFDSTKQILHGTYD